MSSPGLDRDSVEVVSLGDVDPAGSRHLGRRSAVALTDDGVLAGTADGTLRAFDADCRLRWTASDLDGSVVSLATVGEHVVAGERSPGGGVAAYRLADGGRSWRHETSRDVGEPTKEARFQLPFVVDITCDGSRVYVAARRYERRADERRFESCVYAIEADGTVAWRHGADASPISLDVDGDRVAVGYNRCPGDHQHGLVVLDAASGAVTATWDPGTDGQRRVGDVSLVGDGVVVTSHGDYCGYRLENGGDVRWRVPLATPQTVADETVYAYPNHVHATESGAVFITGNTYPVEGRETDARHPEEHTAVGVSLDGDQRWSADVGGFASGLGADGDLLALPGAQHFRDRDAETHGLRLFDVADGSREVVGTDGIVTAAAVADGTVVAVEEPVLYHDEGNRRGTYRLHRLEIGK